MKSETKDLFSEQEQNLFLKNQQGSPATRALVRIQLIPSHWVKISFYVFLVLLLTPVLSALYFQRQPLQANALPFLFGSCFFLSLYSMLLGFLYFHFRIPYMQELKDLLGYKES